MKTIIDISLPISEKTIIYPGNPRVQIRTRWRKKALNSKISFGSHTATHIDAPKHVFPKGLGVDKLNLRKAIGDCRILDMTKVKESIRVQDLRKENIRKGERILVKTRNSQRGFKKFYSDSIYLDGDAAEFLAKKKISLFGIDSLSVKKRGGTDRRPHTELLRSGIVLFEGLDLSKVKPGKYFFIGLPLKFKNLDGSPARAVLLK